MLKEKINKLFLVKIHNLKYENKLLRQRLEEKYNIEKQYIDKIHKLESELREVRLNDKKYNSN